VATYPPIPRVMVLCSVQGLFDVILALWTLLSLVWLVFLCYNLSTSFKIFSFSRTVAVTLANCSYSE